MEQLQGLEGLRFDVIITKPWTDEELYEKYGLTPEEISFIESNIKTMD